MKTILCICVLAMVAAAGNTGCKKNEVKPTMVDSLDIHRSGGFAGFSDHFRITPAVIKMGKNSGDTVVYDSQLRPSKHANVKGLLSTIPQDMVSNNQQSIQPGNDITYVHIISYKGGNAYTYYFNPGQTNTVFATDVNNAFVILTSK